jgi:hypothetical protein
VCPAGLHAAGREASLIHQAADGRLIRFVGTTRWSDFDLFGPERQGRALRAAEYFLRLMATTRHGRPFRRRRRARR